MSIQLIIAVEANKESRSDYRYIDPFIKRYFKIGTKKSVMFIWVQRGIIQIKGLRIKLLL